MKPFLVLHNQASLNGSLTGFDVDMGLYYGILSGFHPDAVLVGSATITEGVKMFLEEIPQETEKDMERPEDNGKPWCVIPDSQGITSGLLHILRQSGYYKDLIILTVNKTPLPFLNYLKERNYRVLQAGHDRVNFGEALEILNRDYHIKRIVTDTGPTLGNILLEQGWADEISLIISPLIIPGDQQIFGCLNKRIGLNLMTCKTVGKNLIHLRYEIINNHE